MKMRNSSSPAVKSLVRTRAYGAPPQATYRTELNGSSTSGIATMSRSGRNHQVRHVGRLQSKRPGTPTFTPSTLPSSVRASDAYSSSPRHRGAPALQPGGPTVVSRTHAVAALQPGSPKVNYQHRLVPAFLLGGSTVVRHHRTVPALLPGEPKPVPRTRALRVYLTDGANCAVRTLRHWLANLAVQQHLHHDR